MVGKGDLAHNNRVFIAENVDRDRISDNIIIRRESVKSVYHELFDKALTEYNSRQKRKDRMIKDYREHIRHSRQEKEFHEVIFQIGNKDDTPVGSEIGQTCAEILRQFAEDFGERNPHLRMFNAVVHMDEATPHLHIDFVPFATEQKRGLSTRVSLSKALEQQGFKSEGKFSTCTKLWIDSEKQRLSELMISRGIEWEKLGTEREHLSVLDYKRQERQKEISALEKDISAHAKKKVKIKAVEDIPTKKSLFGGSVTVSEEDYEKLSDLAKKQIAYEKRENELRGKISELTAKNSALGTENSSLKKEIGELKSVRNRINISALKAETEEWKRRYDRVMNFIESLGLKERLETFLKPKTHHKSR